MWPQGVRAALLVSRLTSNCSTVLVSMGCREFSGGLGGTRVEIVRSDSAGPLAHSLECCCSRGSVLSHREVTITNQDLYSGREVY